MKRMAVTLVLMLSLGLVFLPCSVFALTYSNGNHYDVDDTEAPLPDLFPMTEESFRAMFDSSQAVTNQYFPMTDTTSTRVFESDDGEERFELTNTGPGRVIMGVQTSTQLDRSYEDDLLVEETYDYYAQDVSGNVWYMGEDVTNYIYDDDGVLIDTNTESAWLPENGENLPGWMMVAYPTVGDIDLNYYQEIAPDAEAVDEAAIWGFIDEVVLHEGTEDEMTFENVLQILEYAPSFETGVDGDREYKYYAQGFGLIMVEEGLEKIGDGIWGNPGVTVAYVSSSTAPVPEPGTLILMGTGLLGIVGVGRKKMKN